MSAGSQLFAGLARYLNLHVDQTNFVLSQVGALGLATLFRTVLHPSKATTTTRHLYALTFGILIGYFCFGTQAVHLVILPALCYLIIHTQSPHRMHGTVLAVALLYLSCLHIYRQIYDYGMYGLDITGPLMVITQKVTSFAFSLHDGLTRREEDMTPMQKRHAIKRRPTALEFFSFSLLFPSIMAGPAIFYNNYIEFIEGRNLGNCENRKEPSPVGAVIKKVIVAVACAMIFLKYLPFFPISRLKEENFLENTSMTHKFWYLTVSTSLVRFKYYFAWTLSDAICNNCGLGFNGYNEDGSSKWDQISNVNILKFEFGKSLKEAIEAWNMATNIWFRMIVYERTKRYSTVLTYILSAVWHGFYAGYYITFLTGALFTFAARTIRRHVRAYFIESFEAKLLYDIITFIVTHLVLAYLIFPFVLLEFEASVRVYNKMYWCLHIAAVLALVLVPKLIKKKTPSNNMNYYSSSNALITHKMTE